MVTTILFDLDGTLLPMDQDVFIQNYIGLMVKKLTPYGYDPEQLTKGLWAGTSAMVKNDGAKSNEEVFWSVFNAFQKRDCRQDDRLFMDYYRNEFQLVANVCGCDTRAEIGRAHV